ncbi:MAG: molecular chaperone DnaJ [Deltaproteobacteria bacterium]|nr:molecular chaperone DnaJ [Deltaproteobacteria bacterium]MBW1986583.1 molecular chaperone DnaJ [Deltaproteobacteria bacterium]MBW2133741.1 molecular chaperone DnaJ [Deltaproteobacteria bacterium]
MVQFNKDYYQILGVPRDAKEEDIKKKYRQLALKYHPDRNPGDKEAEERFKEASEAYEVLRDPQKRRLYDQYGHEGLRDTGFTGFHDFSDIFGAFSDIFEDLFGFGGPQARRSGPQAGVDRRYDLDLDFVDAALGTEINIEITRTVNCRSCQGSGVRPGTRKIPCPQCGGRGHIIRSHGFLRISTTCPRCQGRGEIIAEPCPKCRGTGRIPEKKKLSVRIPPGVDNGTHLIMSGEGDEGINGGPPGDLYIVMHVRPHELFDREGYNLRLKLPISFVQAALGDKVPIPTLSGQKEMIIHPGTQPGEIIRLKGEGIPILKGYGRGDLLVEVHVVIPRHLSPKQQELLEEFAALDDSQLASSHRSLPQEGLLKKLWRSIRAMV